MSTATKWVSTLLLPISATALGRLVGDVSDPNDSFQDTAQSEEWPNGPNATSSDIEAKNFHYDIAKDRHWGLSIALTAVISSTLSIREDNVSKIVADSITTRRLSNTSNYFDKACQNDAVREWLERRWRGRRKAYIVTGIITVLNAHITLSQEKVLGTNQGVTIPGSAVLLAATQGAVPTLGGVESVLDSNVAVSGGTTRRTANGFTLHGENILAIQYRQVDFAWFRKPSPRNMSLSNRSKWKAYLGSRGEDSDIGSDEDSMKEDEDTEAAFVMLQAVIGDDIDAADLGEFSTYQDYALDDTEALWLVS